MVAVISDDDRTQVILAPDNGCLTLLLDAYPQAMCFEISPAQSDCPSPSQTFHGRDIFGPVGAQIASGALNPLSGLTALKDPVRFPTHTTISEDAISGYYLCSDRFGNVITTIPWAQLPSSWHDFVLGEHHIRKKVRYYEEAPRNQLVALKGSRGFLEIALKGDDAAQVISAHPGDIVRALAPRE
jgi:hypothetical protein